jgi:hypothetical protein
MTKAEKIAERYGNDGLSWYDADAIHLEEACHDYPHTCDQKDGIVRYTFNDGSVLTLAGGAWDFGYPNCFCWRGGGHCEDCGA